MEISRNPLADAMSAALSAVDFALSSVKAPPWM
jgi:hypothetical protein